MPTEPANNESKRLNRAVVAASERCQSEIAQAVHGTLCQTLGGASLMTKVLAAELHAGNPVNSAQLDELGETLDRALDEARHIFNQLQPVAPGEGGLMSALARLASETSVRMACDFECENAILIDNPEAATALYRIAAEAVRNAVDHAGAKRIKIALADSNGTIVLKISNDGHTFIPQPLREVMQFRAQTAGGTFTSESASGHGTTVTFTLPKGEVRTR